MPSRTAESSGVPYTTQWYRKRKLREEREKVREKMTWKCAKNMGRINAWKAVYSILEIDFEGKLQTYL